MPMTRFSSAERANVPSDELKSFRFQRAFYEAGKRLPERTRALFYAALIDYYFTGVEPNLPKDAANLFEGFRERVAMARTKALPKSDGNGVADEYPPATSALLVEYSTGSSEVGETENAASPAKTSSEVQGSPPGVMSNEYESEESSLGTSLLGDARSFSEFLAGVCEECEEQGAAELVDSGAAERWLRDWIAKGWKDQNGRSLDELLVDGGGASVERWRVVLRGLCRKAGRDLQKKEGIWD